MKEIRTRYGILPGNGSEEYDEEGRLRGIVLVREKALTTPAGTLVPAYSMNTARKKFRNSLEFWPDGRLKSIYLENRTMVETAIGLLPAELITWYEDGGLCRIFPSYGQISAFWSEEDELGQTPEIVVPPVTKNGKEIRCRAADVCFDRNGRLLGVTLMPGTVLEIPTRYGSIPTNFGYDLYENGRVKSLEPAPGVRIETKDGRLYPFRGWGVRFHAENNSLQFDREGRISRIRTMKGWTSVSETSLLGVTRRSVLSKEEKAAHKKAAPGQSATGAGNEPTGSA